jgi:glycerol-3-phosphate dehydrogenase
MPTDTSAHLSPAMNSRMPLEKAQFDVVVIGGGINGVAIARECARAGRRTLLVEQHDFAAGTTSRSTRIIHGGLRYLEHGDFAQVRESLHERQKLLRDYPHLVHPLEFVLALDGKSRRSALAIRAGLWLYRRMAGSQIDHREGQPADFERWLDQQRRFSLFRFEDAQCEFPERLVAEWLVEAMAAGCVVRNHTRLLAVTTRQGRAIGAVLRDHPTGREDRVECSWIINATGPWADEICQHSGVRTPHRMLGGVRGSHIVLEKFAGAPGQAVYTEALDGRPIFIIPWNDQILVGTTEVPESGDPSQVQPSAEEIDYLLSSLAGLFPRLGISWSHIRYAFAGVRPLPYSPQVRPSAIPRRHFFHDHTPDGAAGMISVIGGKLTTAGSVARECVEKIGLRCAPSTIALACESELDCLVAKMGAEVSQIAGVTPEFAHKLVEWYGRRALDLAHRARGSARLKERLCPHTEHIVGEALDAFENQSAVTLADVLLRRVPLALGPCWSTECTGVAAARVAGILGWDAARFKLELEGFDAEYQAFLGQREALVPQAVT